MPIIKPFDQKLFNRCDNKSKKISIEILKQIGLEYIDDNKTEQYGKSSNGYWDLKMFSNKLNKNVYFETELRKININNDSIIVYGRKKKNIADYFIFIDDKKNICFICDRLKFKNLFNNMKQKDFGFGVEEYIDLEFNLGFFYIKDNNKWKYIKDIKKIRNFIKNKI